MSFHKIILMHGDPVICTHEDVAKLVRAANEGARLVMIGNRFINPAIVATTQRYWGEAHERPEERIDRRDPELDEAIKALGDGMRMLG